jgi:adenosine kinase
MAETYKVAVLGPVPRDHITTHEGAVVDKYGCGLNSVAALSALMDGQGDIALVTHVRQIDHGPILKILARFPDADPSYVTCDQDMGDVITLKYLDEERREERQTAFMNPIVPEDLEGLLDADAFVCVPVTDFEIARETLAHIKAHSQGLIILAAHGPTHTCTRRGERHPKFWIDRDLWLPHIDILQMNLEEARCCWYGKEYSPRQLQAMDFETQLPLDEMIKLARHCLDRGVKAVYVTLSEAGCAVYFKDDAGEVRENFVRAVHVDHVVDTTGCVEAFAGGLAFGYLKTGDFLAAARYANAMGAQRCTGTDLAIFKNLTETDHQIAETYPV